MWYTGTIVEAIKLTKQKNAVFVVYVEGKDDASKNMSSLINHRTIRSKLENDKFVAIRIEGGSESYMHFASIYKIVPLPSLFFIGKNGTPLEIGTCAIDSVEVLGQMIDRAQHIFAMTVTDTEKSINSVETSCSSESTKESTFASTQAQSDNCTLKLEKELQDSTKAIKVEEPTSSKISNYETDSIIDNTLSVTPADLAARVEETRKTLELKRRERIEEEKRLQKEREVLRRRGGKDGINPHQWQKEQELQELKNNLRRERLEEQEARQRILAKIASDRAERAQKLPTETFNNSVAVQDAQQDNSSSTVKSLNNSDTSRLHFRVFNGIAKTHSFQNADEFHVVRTFVQRELLQGTGVKEFSLATAYPKREFASVDDSKTLQEYGLSPTAVILVISKQNTGTATAVTYSEKMIKTFNFVFWALVSPVLALFDYFKKAIIDPEDSNNTNKAAGEDKMNSKELHKKTSLGRLYNGPSTSKTSGGGGPKSKVPSTETFGAYVRGRSSNIHRLSDNHDSDDENATWNGNSTQQQ